jgi:hypothetical protein
MLTLQKIMNATPKSIRKRGMQQCKSLRKSAPGLIGASKNSGGGTLVQAADGSSYWEYKKLVKCTLDHHKVILRFYGPIAPTTPVWFSCSCAFFLYYCEYALTQRKSSSIVYCNGKPPIYTNPKLVPLVCKHGVHAALAAMRMRQPAEKTVSAKNEPSSQVKAKETPTTSWYGDNTASVRERVLVTVPVPPGQQDKDG